MMLTFIGINYEFAQILLGKNCNVVIADLSLRPEAETLVSKYKDSSPRAVFVKTDVTSWESQAATFAETAASSPTKTIDIVITSAGVEPALAHQPTPSMQDEPTKPPTLTLDVNLIGTYYSTT